MPEFHEIGVWVHKGIGARLCRYFAKDTRVLAIASEAGRTEDLFHFRQFGAASEVDIVTLFVCVDRLDDICTEIYKQSGLNAPSNGLLYVVENATDINPATT